MAEGFIIPITYQVVNEQVLDEGLRKVDALVKAAGDAVQAAQKAGTAASRSTLKPYGLQDMRVAAAAATRTDDKGRPTNQYDMIHAGEIKRLAEIQEFGKEGLASLLRVKEQIINLLAPYQELEKIITQAAAAQAKFDTYQKESTLNQVKATKTMEAFTELTDRLHAAEARRVEGNQQLARAVMEAEAANKKDLTGLQTKLDLEQKLAEAQARRRNQGTVEMVMVEESKLRQSTAALKAYLDIQEKLAAVRGKAANSGEAKTLIEEEGAFKRLVVTTTELEKVKLKLAEAQARLLPAYQTELQALQQLTREEMIKAETAKLIDKLYKDRASVLAYSSTEYKNEAAALQKLTQEERVAAETAKAMEKAQERLARAVAMTDPAVQKLVEQYKKLEKQQREATAAGTHWSKHIAGLNQLTASFRAALSGVGMGFGIYTSATIVAASATYGLVNAIKQIVAVGAEFTKELSVVNAAMGLTAEQYQTLEKASIEMSASSRYSATQVVQAFREMGMSGFEYQEAMEGVSSVLTLASIGMMSFGQASDITTNVLYGFGLEAADLSRVVDVMAQAVTDSAQTVEQLGTTMSYVAPVAQSFGISLETVTAATQVLVNAGIKSSRAGTGLRRVFTALFSDSENVTKQLGELGVTVNTMAGDMDAELVRVLKAVYAATNGATTGIGNLTKAIGLYGIPSFLALVKSVGEGSDSLEDIISKLQGAGGAAYEMKKRIEDNLAIDFEKLQAAISAVQEKIFMLFGESLRDATQALTAFIRGFAEDNGAIQKFISEMEDVLLVLGIIAGGAVLAAVIKALANVWMAIQRVTIATNAASKAFVLFNSVAQRSLLGSIVKILGGIAALWQGYEVYDALSETIPQVTEETLALSRAQDVLNEAMMGIKVSPEVEGFAVKAKEIKQSEIELEIQLKKVQKEWEVTSEAAIKAQDAGKDTMDVYIKRMEELEKQEKALTKSLESTTKAFKAALKDLMEAEVGVLKSKGMKIEVDLAIKTSELEALKKKLEEGKRIIEEAKESQFQWNPIGDAEGLTKYIAKLNPELALVYARVLELTKQIEELKKEQDKYNATSRATIEALEKEAAALTDAKAAAQLYAEVGERSRNNIDEALRRSASVAREVAEANRIEGMSIEGKIQHYTNIIAAHEDHARTLQKLRDEIAKTEMEYKRLTDLKAAATLSTEQQAELERLTALKEGYGAYQMAFTAGMDTYRNAMEELGKLTQKRIEEMVELKMKLLDLLNTPFEGDFIDSLQGRSEFLMAQADALIAKVNATRDAFIDMNEVASRPMDLSGMTDKLEIMRAIEEESGLVRGLLQAVWQQESGYGKKAGLNYAKVQGEVPTLIRGEFQMGPAVWERGVKAGYDMKTFAGQARTATLELLDAKERQLTIEAQISQYHAGTNKEQWGPKTAKHTSIVMGMLKAINPELELATRQGNDLAAATQTVATGMDAAATGVQRVTSEQAALVDQTGTLRDASVDLVEQQLTSQSMARDSVKSELARLRSAEKRVATLETLEGLEQSELKLRQAALEVEQEFNALRQKTNNGQTATQLELEEMGRLKSIREDLIGLANQERQMQEAVYEEMIKQGKAVQGRYEYTEPKLQALSDGYDSVNTRSRAYLLTMEQIRQLEDRGYLTKTEAMLARIDASLASLHPLARDFAENVSNAFKVLLLEGGNSKEVFTDLKKTLVDMTMERYVIKITTNLIGSVMDPILRSFESVAMNLLYGFGSMLANSVAGLFGGNTTGAGMGIGGVGGLSNLFSLKGLNDLFGGSSIGTSVANGLSKMGIGIMSGGEGAGYEMISQLSPALDALAKVPNIVLGIGSLLGGLASNAIFKGKGYSGIGSSIGGLGGGLGGSALAGTLGLAGGPAGWAIAGIGAILGSIAGGGIGSLFGDKEPRYGTLAAQTGNRLGGLEDWENGPANYSKGAFGLTFGITDKGSKNMKASELKEVYDALAQISNKLADFFGEDLSKFITDELQKMSTFGDGLLHFTENEGDLGGAMAGMVKAIAEAAGRSSEDIGLAFQAMVGDIGGSAEEVAAQIEAAMAASLLVVDLSAKYDERIGEMLNLTGKIGEDVKLLSGYIDQFGKAGEQSSATLARLVTQLGILDKAAEQTATSLDGMTTEALIKLSDEVVKAMGGLENATAQMTFFYQEFTSESEKLADAVKAAAKTINREIPKLQDELMKLSEDVTVTTTQVIEEIQKGVSGIALPAESSSGNYFAGMHDKLVDKFGENMAQMMVSIQEQTTGVADEVNEYWAGMRDKLVDRFGEDLVRMIDAVHGTAESAVKTIAAESEKVTKTITTETTTPGDPNAAVLARLLDDLPKTRQGFEDLIGSIALTTEAGRKLHAALMELAPEFDLLYDGVEAFTDWLLGVDEVGRATRELESVFKSWGMSLPSTRSALEELYKSGVLSAEQMAILAAYLDQLRAVYGDAPVTPDTATNKTDLLNSAYAALEKAVAAEKDAINRAYETRRAALEAERDQINSAYDVRMSAISSEREALSAAHDAAMDAFSQQRDAAQEALSAASSALSSVQSAISKLRGEEDITALDRARALRQLQGWTASGQLPDQERLNTALNTASTLDANDFASQQAYQLEKIRTLSTLDAMEGLAQKQKSDAERMVEAIEAASEAETRGYEAQLAALDREAEAAAAWRDAELARIDQQMDALDKWKEDQIAALDATLEEARKQIEIALGTYEATLSVRDALHALNKLLKDNGADAVGMPKTTTMPTEWLVPLQTTATATSAVALAAQTTATETTALKAEIIALRKDLAIAGTTQVASLKALDDRMRKWDLDGLPPGRSEEDITIARVA